MPLQRTRFRALLGRSPLNGGSLGPRSVNRVLFVVASLGLLVILLPSPASACSCPDRPGSIETLVKRAKKQASHVLEGVVTDVRDEHGGVVIGFRVERSWKPSSPSKNLEIHTSLVREACGYQFEVGKRYLVYAWTEAGSIRTSICTRTRLAEVAQDDLRILGVGKAPRA
jgi:hypothetical protein